MLSDAQSKSWDNLCAKITKNLFTLPYKIVKRQLKAPLIVDSITTEDGHQTENIEETISYILDTLFHTDTLQTNRENSRNITDMQDQHAHVEETHTALGQGYMTDDIPFTEGEVHEAIKHSRKYVAPGPDNTNTSVQTLYESHKAFSVNIQC